MTDDHTQRLGELPAIDELLRRPGARRLAERFARRYVSAAARRLVELWRVELRSGRLSAQALARLVARSDEELEGFIGEELRPLPRRVINATGVVVHTNLGRAPWPELAARRALEAATRHGALEYDIASGRRGRREAQLAKLLLLFPQAEAALAVNNCAAAVLLALNSLAEGREVIVSRGELVEIGGSFRIPDVMAKSGARLREVGTTNRTRLADYERAIGPETAALLKVHPSNYRVVGFTASVSSRELAALGRRRGVLVIEDLGSGLAIDLAGHGVADEPTVASALEADIDLVAVSGDKLFGGPQLGLLLGRAAVIASLRANPLYRALRPDKVALAALDACAELYLAHDPLRDVPVLRSIAMTAEELAVRSLALARELGALSGLEVEVVAALGAVGGGAAPLAELAGSALSIRARGRSAAGLEAALRGAEVPVVARVESDRLLVDLRCVAPDEEPLIVAALAAALAGPLAVGG